MSAEFIRTCKHVDFHVAQFLQFADQFLDGKTVLQKVVLPQHRLAKPPVPWTICYACRAKHPSCWFLSPYEFCQDFAVHRIRRPEKGYAGSKWTKDKAKEDETLTPGKHYVLNKPALKKRNGILMFPTGSVLWDEIADWYNAFRHSYVLVQRSVRVVPCVVWASTQQSNHQAQTCFDSFSPSAPLDMVTEASGCRRQILHCT